MTSALAFKASRIPASAPPSPHKAASVELPQIVSSAFNLSVEVHAMIKVSGVSVNLQRGSFTAIVGGHDSGASELLRCLAGDLPAASGRVFLAGVELSSLGEAQRDEVRARSALVTQTGSRREFADAIIRARSARPDVLFLEGAVDEPLLAYLQRSARVAGQTVVLATSDPATALRADRALVLSHGRLVADC